MPIDFPFAPIMRQAWMHVSIVTRSLHRWRLSALSSGFDVFCWILVLKVPRVTSNSNIRNRSRPHLQERGDWDPFCKSLGLIYPHNKSQRSDVTFGVFGVPKRLSRNCHIFSVDFVVSWYVEAKHLGQIVLQGIDALASDFCNPFEALWESLLIKKVLMGAHDRQPVVPFLLWCLFFQHFVQSAYITHGRIPSQDTSEDDVPFPKVGYVIDVPWRVYKSGQTMSKPCTPVCFSY